MAGETEKYLDQHPFRIWDQNSWTERDSLIDTRFHESDVVFTPLIGAGMTMPKGIAWADYWYPGAEIVKSHVNHETIGREQRYLTPLYIDSRQKRVRARYHWAAKAQYSEIDEMVTRWGGDSDQFINRVLEDQLADQIVGITEKVARDGFLDQCTHKFMYDGNPFTLATYDFSNLSTTNAYAFNVKYLEDIALRMSYRSENSMKKWGNYASPVPGGNFRDSVLIMTTTGVYDAIWQSEEQDWMVDLRQLQDDRIINGGRVQYRNMVIQDTGHAMVLWNAGNVSKTVGVTQVINWGDGAPDPDAGTVTRGVWLAGQSSTDVTHYVQCSAFSASEFTVGDWVSLHTTITAEYGITDGCDPLHGKTLLLEIATVDATNNRLSFVEPITESYLDAMTDASAGAFGQIYAYVTKAQHVHPVIAVASRECLQFVKRNHTDGSFIRFNRPTDNDADLPSIHRVVADWFGEVNPWNLDNYEVWFVAGRFGVHRAITY